MRSARNWMLSQHEVACVRRLVLYRLAAMLVFSLHGTPVFAADDDQAIPAEDGFVSVGQVSTPFKVFGCVILNYQKDTYVFLPRGYQRTAQDEEAETLRWQLQEGGFESCDIRKISDKPQHFMFDDSFITVLKIHASEVFRFQNAKRDAVLTPAPAIAHKLHDGTNIHRFLDGKSVTTKHEISSVEFQCRIRVLSDSLQLKHPALIVYPEVGNKCDCIAAVSITVEGSTAPVWLGLANGTGSRNFWRRGGIVMPTDYVVGATTAMFEERTLTWASQRVQAIEASLTKYTVQVDPASFGTGGVLLSPALPSAHTEFHASSLKRELQGSVLCCLGIALRDAEGTFYIAFKNEGEKPILSNAIVSFGDPWNQSEEPIAKAFRKLFRAPIKIDDTSIYLYEVDMTKASKAFQAFLTAKAFSIGPDVNDTEPGFDYYAVAASSLETEQGRSVIGTYPMSTEVVSKWIHGISAQADSHSLAWMNPMEMAAVIRRDNADHSTSLVGICFTSPGVLPEKLIPCSALAECLKNRQK